MRGSSNELTNHPGGRCLQGAVDARWVVVVVVVVVVVCLFVCLFVVCCLLFVVCRRRLTGGHFGLIVLRHTASWFCHQ